MEKLVYETIGETLYHKKMNNGLEVFLLPKKEFNKTFATFTTKYGSIDNTFAPLNTTDLKKVPDGIAHFLEHKMFEKKDGDVFFEFSSNGANANAFTAFNRTAYLFSSTDNVWNNLELLINFVQDPYFTKETVEKEKGIIGQEIKMYDDDPDWRTYFGLIENLYQEHPIKIDIAGTVESIAEITDELLYECYNTFYHPSNMVLFVVGKFDAEDFMNKIEANQNAKTFEKANEIIRGEINEPNEVNERKRKIYMPIKTPKMYMGIKLKNPDLTGNEQLERELSLKIALDILFSKSSENYMNLFDQGLINDTFGYEYDEEGSYGFALMGGDTFKPDELEKALLEIISNVSINQDDFERTKRRKIGSFLSSLNSLEYIANQFTRYYFNNMNLFEVKDILMGISYEDFSTIVKDFFDPNQVSVIVCAPKK